MRRAFILGAGLGNRLRPLTAQLPKPLIPVHHRPLITYAFAHLHAAGVREFTVNTHHLPEAYGQAFPENSVLGCPVTFRHEPLLLETGGGIANVADLLHGEPFWIYNGDILTDLPLDAALSHHRKSGNAVTLILRSQGAVENVALDQATGKIIDLRNARGTNHPDQFQFTGIWLCEPSFMKWLPTRGLRESVVEAWLRAIDDGVSIGGVVLDDGLWFDLGDRASYLKAHETTKQSPFPAWSPMTALEKAPAHPAAAVHPSAFVDEASSIAPGATVEAGARIVRSILWKGALVKAGAHLADCIVLSGGVAAGTLTGLDIAPVH